MTKPRLLLKSAPTSGGSAFTPEQTEIIAAFDACHAWKPGHEPWPGGEGGNGVSIFLMPVPWQMDGWEWLLRHFQGIEESRKRSHETPFNRRLWPHNSDDVARIIARKAANPRA